MAKLYRAGVDPLKAMKIVGHTRVSDHSGHLHPPGSRDAEGHGGRYGQRIQDCEHSGQAEPVQAAGAEDTGRQGDPVPQGGRPGLIFPGISVPGSFLLFLARFYSKNSRKCSNYILICTDDSYTIYCNLKRASDNFSYTQEWVFHTEHSELQRSSEVRTHLEAE